MAVICSLSYTSEETQAPPFKYNIKYSKDLSHKSDVTNK